MRWSDMRVYLSWTWGFVLATLCFSHSINSFSIILLAAVTLLAQFSSDKPGIAWDRRSYGLLLLPALLLLQVIAFFLWPDQVQRGFEIERKLALLVIPLLWVFSRLRWNEVREILFICFASGLVLSGLLMLGFSTMEALTLKSLAPLFYDRLVQPVPISPIYFSWYLALGLFWPVGQTTIIPRKAVIVVRVFFGMLLLLSASKLFVILAFLLGIAQWARQIKRARLRPWHAVIAALALISIYPVTQRYLELKSPHLELVTANEFQYDSPFNGLNLRLVQWRFGVEILNDQGAWIFGVGPAAKQDLLNAKYDQYGMYTGNPNFGDVGYRKYNFHNQYVETTVANGLVGFICLFTLLVYIFRIKSPNRPNVLVVPAFICAVFMLTESMMERQQGIVMFCILMSIALQPNATDKNEIGDHVE